jgi:hypothetical protein
MDSKRIAAVAALTVAMAAPAFAQAATPRGTSAQHQLQRERTYRHAHHYAYRPAYHYAYRPAYRYGTGFWPADVAAGIVGGAIGTACAIVAAPFGPGPYAYYNDPYAYAYP